MVGMGMGDQHGINILAGIIIVCKSLQQHLCRNTEIDQNPYSVNIRQHTVSG